MFTLLKKAKLVTSQVIRFLVISVAPAVIVWLHYALITEDYFFHEVLNSDVLHSKYGLSSIQTERKRKRHTLLLTLQHKQKWAMLTIGYIVSFPNKISFLRTSLISFNVNVALRLHSHRAKAKCKVKQIWFAKYVSLWSSLLLSVNKTTHLESFDAKSFSLGMPLLNACISHMAITRSVRRCTASSLHRRRTATGRSYRRRCTCSRTGGSGSRPAHHRTRSTSNQGRLGCSPRSL